MRPSGCERCREIHKTCAEQPLTSAENSLQWATVVKTGLAPSPRFCQLRSSHSLELRLVLGWPSPDRFYPAALLTMSVRTPSESEPGSAALSFSFQLKDEQVQEKNEVLFQFQGPLGSQPSLAQPMLPWQECASSWTIRGVWLIFPLRRPELARVSLTGYLSQG